MLDMCDLHDFCYRDTPSLVPGTYTLIFGDPVAYSRTRTVTRSCVCVCVLGCHLCCSRVEGRQLLAGGEAVTRRGRKSLGINSARLNYKICLISECARKEDIHGRSIFVSFIVIRSRLSRAARAYTYITRELGY